MKPTRLRAPTSTRGVTLIELMIVIVILGILAAITGPSVRRSIERSAAKSNARDVANVMRMARNQAMSRGEVLLVRMTPAAAGTRGKIEILRSSDINGLTDTEVEADPSLREPARNCRQTSLAKWAATDVVHTTTLDGKSGRSVIAAVDPPLSGTLDLCFSPDGRVLSPSTAAVPSPEKYGGCDENVVIVVADEGAALGTLATCTGVQEGAAVDPIAVRDSRDTINLYRIAVSYNGSVKVAQ